MSLEISVVESYAQLRKLVPRHPGVIQVLGAAKPGDGGAGTFHWEPVPSGEATPADDGGTLIRSPRGVWHRLFNGAVDVTWFGAGGDDAGNPIDSTTEFERANRAGLHLRVPAGRCCYLENWVPLAGTTLDCTGATIRLWPPAGKGCGTQSANPAREDPGDEATPPSKTRAAIVVRNDNLTIVGALFEEASEAEAPAKAPWTGCILVERGSGIAIRDCEIRNAWSGLFGWKQPDPHGAMARDLRITGCYLHDCSHNIYLSDVDRLTIDGCRSCNSSRDAIKTARNCMHITITNNFLYDNGNEAGDQDGQSMDGIDLFAGGRCCLIAGNYIYRNRTKGIDIKRAQHSADQPECHDCEIVIAGNHIFDNTECGIEIESAAPHLFVKDVAITNNQIHGNRLWGARLKSCLHLSVTNNTIYDNFRDGLRIEKCPAGALVSANLVYGNGRWIEDFTNAPSGQHRAGILVIGHLERMLVETNLVYDRLDGTQRYGIVRKTDDDEAPTDCDMFLSVEATRFLADNATRD